MADNVQAEAVVTPGATFATDDNAGVQHPYVKIEWGADNVYTKVDSGAGAMPVQDGGNSLTVDGVFFQATQPVSAASLPLPTGAATLAGQTQPGVDIGDVTVNNGAGASAVNVQDGGNSLTVDVGTALPTGTNNIGDVDVLTIPAPLSTSGGGTEATALRVTVASDSTGVLSIDDNGGSLTVDGTVTANAGTGDFLLITGHTRNEGFKEAAAIGGELDDTGPVVATEGNISPARITAQRAIHVNLRDNAGAEVSVGGGTQYDEDTAHVSGDKVTLAGVVQQAADAGLSGDGDRSLLQVDASGFLKVNVKTGGTAGTQYVEDAVAAADPTGTALIAVRNDARSGSLTSADGDNVALRGTNSGEIYVKHVDAIPVTDNAGSLTVDQPTGTNLHTVVDSGSITANAGTNLNTSTLALEAGGNLATVSGAVRAEDAASANAHTGIGTLAVRKATPANTSDTDGDYEFLQMSAGRLWTSAVIDTAIPAGSNNIGDVDVLTLPASVKTIKRAVGNATTSGDNTAIAAPGASKVIKVISYALQGVGTVNGKFTDGAGGTQLSMLWNFQAREGAYAQPTVIPQFHFKCTANTALILNCSSTAGMGYEITYWDDDAT